MHYILFPDVTNAQRLYDLMKAEGIKCTFAPTPREADKCCGVSVLYYDDSYNALIMTLIHDNGVNILKFFEGASGNPDRLKFC